MPKSSYFWSRDEERKLMELWNSCEHDVRLLAVQLNRKPEAVRKKLDRLGLVVGHEEKSAGTTTIDKEEETRIRLDIPVELPSVEEALKILAAAMNALSQPGLSRADIQRLAKVVNAVKAYQKLFGEYMQYREIEVKLEEYADKYEQLAKEMGLKAPAVRRAWSRIVNRKDRNVLAAETLRTRELQTSHNEELEEYADECLKGKT